MSHVYSNKIRIVFESLVLFGNIHTGLLINYHDPG